MGVPSFRLNAMQALMRRFAELAPYNFVHAMRIAGPATIDRWREAATPVLAEMGLGVPRWEGDQVTFSTASPAAIEIAQGDLQSHLDIELNRPFALGDTPLRFFVVEAADDTHWFGVVIDHWLADDYSCRQLLHRIFLRYHSSEGVKDLPPLRIASIVPEDTALSTLRALPDLLRRLAEHRKAIRVSLGDPRDFTVRTFQRQLPESLLATIRHRAKEHGATVHDFFLAACAQACGEFRESHAESAREGVALATVASLRPTLKAHPSVETAFGCTLSYYTSTIFRPETAPAPELLRAIVSRTRAAKRDLPKTASTLQYARWWWDRSRSDYARAMLFQRGMPNVCGLSNVNLSGSWIEQAYPTLREYRRVGPAGPIAPLIFMLTSIAGRIYADVTYRTTALTQPDAERLADRFSERLQTLAC